MTWVLVIWSTINGHTYQEEAFVYDTKAVCEYIGAHVQRTLQIELPDHKIKVTCEEK